MYPGGVALKANGLGGLGGVEWPLVTAKDSEQGLATLTGQGAMNNGLPAADWHSAIITHHSYEKHDQQSLSLYFQVIGAVQGCNIAYHRDKKNARR
jgi:hypothetical protein